MKQTIYQKGWICNLRNPQGFRGCYKSTSANHKDRIGNQRVFVFVCIDLRTFGVHIDGMTGDFESGFAAFVIDLIVEHFVAVNAGLHGQYADTAFKIEGIRIGNKGEQFSGRNGVSQAQACFDGFNELCFSVVDLIRVHKVASAISATLSEFRNGIGFGFVVIAVIVVKI